MDKIQKKYFLGLDIGTESCGWAVTDLNYNLMKAKGKHLWGVRLFDEAQDATERRGKRASRRRLVRRKLKLMWLREIFEKEIKKIDPHFLNRMKYSSLWEEDKQKMDIALSTKDSLFADSGNEENYSDVDYYNDYKNIYELRQELLERPAKDIRLLYLALHNIIKRRGHFLLEGEMNEEGKGQGVLTLINNLIEYLNEIPDEMFAKDKDYFKNINPITEGQEENIVKLIRAKDKNITFKKKTLASYLNIVKNDAWKSISDALINGKFNVSKIFKIEGDDKAIYSFDDENYETVVLGNLENMLSEEQMTALAMIRKIYSKFQLEKILNGKEYICQAMVARYGQHQQQLKEFKQFIKTYIPSQYNRVFRQFEDDSKKHENSEVNYAFYVDYDKYNGKKYELNLADNKNIQERFYKFVKMILSLPVEVENFDEEKYEFQKQKFLDLIEASSFLPKLRTRENAVFPNQLYRKEVKKILEVNSQKYPFLNEKDNSGLTNSEKIIQILKFRIPYFVGPLGGTGESKNSWANRDKSVDIKPWNLEKMVDFNKAEDEFIKRMLNTCTYITNAQNDSDGKVLPKNSLLYSKFRVLNELNNLKINADPISVELKQSIFNGLFCNEKKVTVNKLKKFLVNEGRYSHEEIDNIVITGIDKEFANNFAPYIEFKNIFGEQFVEQNQAMIDTIISYITIISDKTRLENRIKREFGDRIDEQQIKKIKGLNYSGWGRLSELFLQNMVFDNKKTQAKTTIIAELWHTNRNLQEILFNSDYNVQEVLKDYQQKVEGDITYSLIEESYCSPSVKRAVWQTLLIIKELRDTLGSMPEKIFVEVTRKDGDKVRTKSRKNNLLSLYNSKEFKDNVDFTMLEIDEELKSNLEQQSDLELRSDKYYLYYMQLGKDIYTGKKIDINDLANYDIDHIIPQSIIKDDSLNNRVLTHKIINNEKQNFFPCCDTIPAYLGKTKEQWFGQMKALWLSLLKSKLITQEKFNRLSRETPLSQEETGGFVARQLVETSQAATSVLDVLKNLYEDQSNLIYSKAHFVSEFRQIHDIFKSRDVNDLHHAKDAYLNIVVGNILHNKFTKDPRKYYTSKYNLDEAEEERNERRDEKSDLIRKVLQYQTVYNEQTGEVIWNPKRDLEKIKKICERNDVLISQKTEVYSNGAYYDETVYKKNDAKSGLIPLKGDPNNPLSNVERYGGYNSSKGAYFMVMESEDKKGNKIKTIETLPIMVYQKHKNDENFLQKYLEYVINENTLKNARLLTTLKYKSTLQIGKGLFLLTGKTGERFSLSNFNQWFVDNETQKYVKVIRKYIDIKTKKQDERLEEKDNKVILSRPKTHDELFNHQKEIALTRQDNILLYNKIIKQLDKPFYKNTTFVNTIQKSLIEKEEMFNNLPVRTQAEVLYNLVKKLHRGVATLDLSLLGLDKNMGKVLISKNITDKNIKLIITSPTGLYRRVVKL